MLDLSGVRMIPRPQMFRSQLRDSMDELRANTSVYFRGGRASGNSYCGGVTRQRVRTLARKMARERMKSIRTARAA